MNGVEMVPISTLTPYARNARVHSPDQVARIAASIQHYGWTIPVLVDEHGTIIAGHGRVMAAQQLGITEAPVLRAVGWSDEKRRAYTLADNRLTDLGEWDAALLRDELDWLRNDAGYDLELAGFSGEDEIASALAREDHTEDDRAPVEGEDIVPEPPEAPVTREGDVWVMGGHRIICGDATDAKTVRKLLAGARPMVMVTDPPYGVNYDPSWRNEAGAAKSKRTGKVLNDDRADWREAWNCFPGDVAYVWHGALHTVTVAESLVACGFATRAQIIWAKDRLVLGRGDYHWQHEPCWYAVRKGGKGHWAGDRKQTTLWDIPNRDQDATTVHGTQKPVECMRRPIINNTKKGDAVYEPFSGSGTTIIAAEATGRVCYALELSPTYVDVAVTRWQNFTGQEARLEGDNLTFSEVAAQRLSKA